MDLGTEQLELSVSPAVSVSNFISYHWLLMHVPVKLLVKINTLDILVNIIV